jgi:hypothetical protein
MKIFTPEDFKKYFYASLFLAIICLILAIVAIGESGQANSATLSISGIGDLYVRNDMEHFGDLAGGNGQHKYKSKMTWGLTDWGISRADAMESEYYLNASYADWANEYRIMGSGAGHKVNFVASKISGQAEFANEIKFSFDEAGTESFDSTIHFDTRDGSSNITAKVWNSTAGRPATMTEIITAGKFLIDYNLNISKPKITPENWLGTCETLDRDMILDKTARGLYIMPDGYVLDKYDRLVPINGTA